MSARVRIIAQQGTKSNASGGIRRIAAAAQHLFEKEPSRFHRAIVWLENRSKPALLVTAILLLLLIGLFDYATGPEIGFSLFYLLPVSFAAWVGGRRGGIAIAIGAAITWLAADFLSGADSSHPAIPFWNMLFRLGIFAIVVELLARLRSAHGDLAKAVDERTALLSAEIAEHTQAISDTRAQADRHLERIAYDLHDGVCQFLTGIAFKVKVLQENIAGASPAHAEETQRIVELINDAVGQVRNVVHGLAPPEIEFNELLAALRTLALETQELFQVRGSVNANRTTLPVNTPLGMHLFRIAQEAINNAIKHGGARQIDIDVFMEDAHLTLIVSDDGCGFAAGPGLGNGLGLRTMRHRAAMLGGNLHIDSQPGRGTEVRCVIPNAPPSSGDSKIIRRA
jgi:signal transduction histidine kinase